MFENFNFPIVKNVSERTIAEDLITFVPTVDHSIQITEDYVNHWGARIVKYNKGGVSIIGGPADTFLYGDYGHAMLFGMYVIDENREMISAYCEKGAHIRNLSVYMYDVLEQINRNFIGFDIERGLNNTLYVNDQIVDGVTVYPGYLGEVPTTEDIRNEVVKLIEKIENTISEKRIEKGKRGI
jgi:hypothetical protein